MKRLPSSTQRRTVAWKIDKDDFKAPRSAKPQPLGRSSGLRVAGGFMTNMTPLEAKARSEFGKVVLAKTEGSVGTDAGASSANESNSVAAAVDISLRKVLKQERWWVRNSMQYIFGKVKVTSRNRSNCSVKLFFMYSYPDQLVYRFCAMYIRQRAGVGVRCQKETDVKDLHYQKAWHP